MEKKKTLLLVLLIVTLMVTPLVFLGCGESDGGGTDTHIGCYHDGDCGTVGKCCDGVCKPSGGVDC